MIFNRRSLISIYMGIYSQACSLLVSLSTRKRHEHEGAAIITAQMNPVMPWERLRRQLLLVTAGVKIKFEVNAER